MMEWKVLDSFKYLYKGGVNWVMITRLYKHAASDTFKLVLSSIVAAYVYTLDFVRYRLSHMDPIFCTVCTEITVSYSD